MQHQEFKPPEALADSIKCFWYNREDFGELPSDFEVVPDGYAEIIFHFGSGCSIIQQGSPQPLPSPFLMGLLNQPVVFTAKNCLEIIGIRCYPWTVFDLLGLPPGNDGIRIFKHPIAHMQPALSKCVEAGSIDKAIVLVQQYFLEASLSVAANTILLKAGEAMTTAHGTLPVKQVAAAAHATVRTLQRKFRQSSGHTVKNVSALMRFEQVRNHLWIYPNANLAALAYEQGYTDQSHLNREFKRYSGTTPAAFAQKAKQEKKFIGNNFVAFVQA